MTTEQAPRIQLRRSDAERAIEALRLGIPPTGWVRYFTVGRQDELKTLEESLSSASGGRGSALLVRANYGAGKSHLLHVVRESALKAGYAVAYVTLDAHNGVRFNRMVTIFAAICRNLQVPDFEESPGITGLFERYQRADQQGEPSGSEARAEIGNDGRWSMSEYLTSAGMYVALRAWTQARSQATKDTVISWLESPEDFNSQRRELYQRLVNFRGRTFSDPRPENMFYWENVFTFSASGHSHAWAALADLQTLAQAAGLRGVVLLFDEFEDVVQNLRNKSYEQAAFMNLFRFFAGDRFPGMAYFAVTPEFSNKCKSELLSRKVYDFPYDRFDSLPHFELSRIGKRDFITLASRIRSMHGIAYDWPSAERLGKEQLSALVHELYSISSQDQTRQAIEGVVTRLDTELEDALA